MHKILKRKVLVTMIAISNIIVPLQINAQMSVDKDSIMAIDSLDIPEVVVVGYGTQQRQQLTKAISSISERDIELLAPISGSIQDLLGSSLAKGVLSIQNSGEPGTAPTINIRGVTSPYPNETTGIMNNSPLYVIDGVPMFVEATGLNPLINISPTDIERIEILKDAAATAIYGSRGANGVVIIKTKDGKKNQRPQVSVGYTFSISNPIKRNKVLNNSEFRNLQNDLVRNGVDAFNAGLVWDDYPLTLFGNISKGEVNPETGMYTLQYHGLLDSAFGNENINWEKAIENSNATSNLYNFSVRGGSDFTTYSFSLHGNNKEGLYKNDQLDTYGGRLSLTSDICKYLTVGVNANYSESNRKFAITDNVPWTVRPLAVRPDFPIYSEDGNLIMTDEIGMFGGSGVYSPSPVAMLQQKNKLENNQFITRIFANVNIFQSLKFRMEFGHLNYKNTSSYFLPKVAQQDWSEMGQPTFSTLQATESKYSTSTLDFQLLYNESWGKHSINAIAGYGTERNRNHILSSFYEGFPDDDVLNNVGSATFAVSQSELIQRNGLNSFYTRANYGFLNRYFGEVSFRADKSSKFGPNNRWGYFPAFSAGWIINRESLLKEQVWIDNLKLRASIGQTGSTNIDDFSYYQFYLSNGQYGGSSSIELEDVLPNKGVRWEKTTEYNIGLDFSFFNHRLYGNVDLYLRNTNGALAPAPHIVESGLGTYFDNIIDLSNKGFEMSIGGDVIRTKDFTWNSMLNIASNRSKITRLNNAQLAEELQDAFIVGYPVGTIKGYIVDQIINDKQIIDDLNAIAWDKYESQYQFSTGVGDYLYKDLDQNGIIDEGDKTVVVNPEPKLFGGWFNQLSYKNLSLSFIFQFSCGGEALYSQLQEDACAILGHSVSREMYGNYWTPENPDAKYARLAAFLYNSNAEINDRYVFSTSYCRLKNLTLGYQIPTKLLKDYHIAGMYVFASATNLFTITKWPGVDPETLTTGAAYMGRNNDPYPLGKTFSIGFNINF